MSESLIKTFTVQDVRFDLGSDWHLNAKAPNVVDIAIEHILKRRRSEMLLLLGDLFNARQGEDTSASINELIHELSERYDSLVFVAGNHCLRGRKNPWVSFDFGNNVYCPVEDTPLELKRGETRFLFGNIFYDMRFLSPSILGVTPEEVLAFYKNDINDGRYLLEGNPGSFPAMAEALRRSLTEETDVLVTHTLPHPSLVTFRIAQHTYETRKLETELGIPFICNPKDDEEKAKRESKPGKPQMTPEAFRRYWNMKSLMMGSDILSSHNNWKNGLTLVHGHHHRNDLNPRIINGKRVRIVTHQPPNGEGMNILFP